MNERSVCGRPRSLSRNFYPKRLTNENIKIQLTSKLTISYIKENHLSGSVKGVEIECRRRGMYRKRCSRGGRKVQGKCQGRNCSLKSWVFKSFDR